MVAYKNKDWVKVHFIQEKLAMSFDARSVAVRRVTVNDGKKTPRFLLHIPKIPEIYFLEELNLLQPCAVKVACTVVRGGKLERAYLSRSDQQVYFSGELKQK